MQRILIYTRGGDGFGMGHLYRTSWLLESLRDMSAQSGHPAPELAVRCMDTAAARGFWDGSGENVEYMPGELRAAASALPLPTGEDTLLIDWLDSPPELLRELKSEGARLILLDDYGPGQREARLVMNSLLAPLEDAERMVGSARVVSGFKYLTLNPALLRLRRAVRGATRSLAQIMEESFLASEGPVRAVMLNFGGEPVPAAIELALAALAAEGYGGRVIVMPAERSLRIPGGLDVELREAGRDFHDVLAACDMCICAGGLALYEAAMLGVPAVAIALVPHQQDTGQKLSAAATCLYAGALDELNTAALRFPLSRLLSDSRLRAMLSARGQHLIDGMGSQRVALEILSLAASRGKIVEL